MGHLLAWGMQKSGEKMVVGMMGDSALMGLFRNKFFVGENGVTWIIVVHQPHFACIQ